MHTHALHCGLSAVAAFTLLALLSVGAAGAMPPGPDAPTPRLSSATGAEPVFDDGTWTIETMLAERHAQLTPTWWESLF